MAHVAKYTATAVGHLFNHYGRAEIDGNVSRSNENIDDSLTENNYNVAAKDQPMSQADFLQKRLSEVRVHKRADVNVLADWVVTLPKDFEADGEDEKLFFDAAYVFLKQRYGAENVVSAWVHRDETRPHMHFAFVPVVEDKKRGGFKLSAKEAIDRTDLRSFHGDLDDFMRDIFQRDVGILNEATREGNQSIADLKRKTAIEERNKLAGEVSALQGEKKSLQGEIKRLKGGIDKISLTQKQIGATKARRTLFGWLKGVTLEDFEAMKSTAINGAVAIEDRKKLRREVKGLRAENAELTKEAQNLRKKVPTIREKTQIREWEQKAAAFDRLPDPQKKRLLSQDLGKKRDFGKDR